MSHAIAARNWSSEMILLTGAAGMGGQKILAALGGELGKVRALVRSEARAAALPPRANVEVVVADMSEPSTLGRALEGVETVLLISSGDERMAETQMRFVDAAKVAGVRRIVKFSGQEAGIGFDASAFRFTRMHDQIERHIEHSGLRWTHFRPAQFMQVYLREARSIARDGVIALPLAEVQMAPVDLVDVAGIAVGILKATDVDSVSMQITGPEALTIGQIAQILTRALGRPVTYEPLSVDERMRRLLAAGTPEIFVEALREQAIERLRRPLAAVVTGAHRRFGVKATTFAQFASRNRAAFLSAD
ncbi:MAG: NAD(P)H-binding protein [Burkholderiaceae bacterium]